MPKERSLEEKLAAIKAYTEDHKKAVEIAHEFGINRNTLYKWKQRYEQHGLSGLKGNHRRKITEKRQTYSPELKIAAVRAYRSGKGSLTELCKRFQIRSMNSLQKWIKAYNSGGNYSLICGGNRMSTTRKTTQEERIRIVRECLESGKDYGAMALKYGVSYQQVRGWTLRFEELGEVGLEDRRGKRKKNQTPRTELEAAQIEIERLKYELYKAEMERDLLKKLDEIERRDASHK